jgi:hypothetical protein
VRRRTEHEQANGQDSAMSEADPAETLVEYELMVNRLLEHSSKQVTARAARVLASYVGHYQLRHGMISEADLPAMNAGQPGAGDAPAPARLEELRVLAAALTLAALADTRWD